jgi:hypothetical protein
MANEMQPDFTHRHGEPIRQIQKNGTRPRSRRA